MGVVADRQDCVESVCVCVCACGVSVCVCVCVCVCAVCVCVSVSVREWCELVWGLSLTGRTVWRVCVGWTH